MAIPVIALTLAVTKDEVARNYPGGLSGFIERYPVHARDGHLIGLSFASKNDLYQETGRLLAQGVLITSIAVVDQIYGQLEQRDWLEIGELDGRPVCWLQGDAPANAGSWSIRGFQGCRP